MNSIFDFFTTGSPILVPFLDFTDTEGKQRKARVQNILKSSKKTQYLMNTLYMKLEIKVFKVQIRIKNVRIQGVL